MELEELFSKCNIKTISNSDFDELELQFKNRKLSILKSFDNSNLQISPSFDLTNDRCVDLYKDLWGIITKLLAPCELWCLAMTCTLLRRLILIPEFWIEYCKNSAWNYLTSECFIQKNRKQFLNTVHCLVVSNYRMRCMDDIVKRCFTYTDSSFEFCGFEENYRAM
jgi:hypothetical protein